MPSKTESQRRLFGMCYGAMKRGEKRPANCPKVSMKVAREFARKVKR